MAFPESGYYVSRGADGDHLVFDAGPHGYLNGGHAHADALSIVGTVGNLPLLIDPGTATYTMDRVERDLFRGTAMHNTITLDGEGQSMPRGPFHWSRTARATASIWRSAPGCDYAEGTHDGYLPRRHTRAILAVHGLGWFIVDHLVGAGTASAAIHWHLHPQWILDTTGPRGIVAAQGEHEIGLGSSEPLRIVEPGSDPLARFSPAYGVTAPAPLVQVRADVSLPISFATFIATRTAPVRLERLEVTVAPPPGWLAAAFRAEWPTGTMTLLSAVELTGVATTASAAPDQLWGTSTVQTDGRVAALIEGSTGGPEVLLVNAHHAAGAISHHAPERVGLIRWPAGRVASSVHERSAPNP